MNRRQFVAGSAITMSLLGGGRALRAAEPAEQPFDAETVRSLAKQLAAAPYSPPDRSLPPALADMKYDAYRSIRFQPSHALWRAENLPFQLQFFHRGWLFKDKVEIYTVSGGRAKRIAYSPDRFSFGLAPPSHDPELGFAGFRIHGKINRPDYYDEIGVFLGASYFRAVAKGQLYGLSARGLALRTGNPQGEEFPIFKTFWIETPAPRASTLTVHALLDSPSVAGAFHFTITPGEETIYDTRATLYPRVDLTEAGIAPGTSMFFFDANERTGFDDFRPAVHDSDGLAIHRGNGEQLWRALKNPKNIQVSIFDDKNIRGFGLIQRDREFSGYQDLESHFEKRPSLWVEPVGQWEPGSVQLAELPSDEEIHDNIVAFWRPTSPLKAHSEYNFTYRLHWTDWAPGRRELARFAKTRIGAARDGNRLFVLDAVKPSQSLPPVDEVKADIIASKGIVSHIVLQSNPESGGIRLSFELDPMDEPLIELRCALTHSGNPLSETWLYQWTA